MDTLFSSVGVGGVGGSVTGGLYSRTLQPTKKKDHWDVCSRPCGTKRGYFEGHLSKVVSRVCCD